jgi:hypothetical protein
MWRRQLINAVVIALFIGAAVLPSSAQRKRKNEEPKSQVLPLPPELPMALAADTATLDFHISPLLKTGGLSAQIRQSLNDLIRDTRGETIVKLRAFVAGAGDARRVQAQVSDIFSERRLALPVLTIVQVGALAEDRAQVVIEAVVSTHRTVNPSGLAFLAGQRGTSLPDALERLKRSLSVARVSADRLLTATCFTSRLDNYAGTLAAFRSMFPNAGVNIVQAVRDPANDVSLCQAIGQLSEAPQEAQVVWLEQERTTLVNSRQLVFTGMQLTFGNFLDDAQQAFQRLQRAAGAFALQVPIEVSAFSLNSYAASALSKTTSFPNNTFMVQIVEGLPAVDASAGIEAVLAPNVEKPATRSR